MIQYNSITQNLTNVKRFFFFFAVLLKNFRDVNALTFQAAVPRAIIFALFRSTSPPVRIKCYKNKLCFLLKMNKN